MGRSRYKIYDQSYPYFMTSSIVEGIPLFSDPVLVQPVLESICFIQTRRELQVIAYVIMENHIHLIAQHENMVEIMRRFKSFTARRIIESLIRRGRFKLLEQLRRAKLEHKVQSRYQVWQEGYHPKQIVSDKMLEQKVAYIHNNPVKRGYVDRPEHWRYSSARNYAGLEGLIPVTL